MENGSDFTKELAPIGGRIELASIGGRMKFDRIERALGAAFDAVSVWLDDPEVGTLARSVCGRLDRLALEVDEKRNDYIDEMKGDEE